MAKVEIPDLAVCVDLGGSLTKMSVATADGQRYLLALASEVSEIPQATLSEVQSGFWGEGNPESSVWVGVKDGSSYAVGSFARKYFKSQIDLAISKTDLAVPKILGAFWVLQQKLNLDSSFYVRLGILLPAGECSEVDCQELSDLLKPALRSFTTPTGKMSVRLFNQPVIKPEGGGVFLHYKKNAKVNLNKRRTGILGIGFRNANLLICDRGTIAQGDRHTCDLGFHALIRRCTEIVGTTVSEVDLAAAVAKAGHEVNSRIINKFLVTQRKERRETALIEAIGKSQQMYWSQLTNWFKYVNVDSFDDLVLYGGTAEYLKQPLTEHFQERIEGLSWHSEVKVPSELLNNAIAEPEQMGLEFRFIDCWCLLEFICSRQTGYSEYQAIAAAGALS